MKKIVGLLVLMLVAVFAPPVSAYSTIPDTGFNEGGDSCVDYEVVFARGSGTMQNESAE